MNTHIVCDSSMLASFLDIPGKDQFSHEVHARMNAIKEDDSIRLYLPWAAVIECGNHIEQMTPRYPDHKRERALKLSAIVKSCLDGVSPFSRLGFWDEKQARQMIDVFPNNVMLNVGMGDTSILADCQRLCARLQLRDELQIDLWTYDEALKNLFLSQRSSWLIGADGILTNSNNLNSQTQTISQ